MGCKTILNVIGVEETDSDVRMAMDYCREIDGHLSILTIAVATPMPIGDYGGIVSQPWFEQRQADVALMHERIRQITDVIAESELSADIDSSYAETFAVDDVIGRRARYTDLVLIGPELAELNSLEAAVLRGALFEAQRPVLIVPSANKLAPRPRTVLVAWDAGVVASRAVHESLDLLTDAEEVRVVMVDPEETPYGAGDEPGADLAAYLARHGASVTVDRLPAGGHSIAEVLCTHAVDTSAEMIIMGAYGHSHMRQRLFGGVTQTMIDATEIPLLLAR